MSTRHALLCALLAAPVLAQVDYFPLGVGNQWIYRSSAGDILQLEVTAAAEFGGVRYYRLHGLDSGDYWLRRDEKGSVVAYDPDLVQERLWYAFFLPAGQTYQTFVPGSDNSPAVVASNKATYSGPVGWFDWALEIQYAGTFQVGLYRELFLPYIGMVRREQGGGGPRMLAWDLIYVRLGGVTYVSEASVSFGLTLDRSSYPAADQMIARFTLRNNRWEELPLQFPTSQVYDFELRDSSGGVVYRWSDGKAFLQGLHSETLGFGEKNYALLVPLADGTGKPLPAGKYTAEARLTTENPNRYRAAVGLEIAAP